MPQGHQVVQVDAWGIGGSSPNSYRILYCPDGWLTTPTEFWNKFLCSLWYQKRGMKPRVDSLSESGTKLCRFYIAGSSAHFLDWQITPTKSHRRKRRWSHYFFDDRNETEFTALENYIESKTKCCKGEHFYCFCRWRRHFAQRNESVVWIARHSCCIGGWNECVYFVIVNNWKTWRACFELNFL